MKKYLLLFVLFAAPVSAQVVTNPTRATFEHPDADLAITASYRFEFFQCASITAGSCVGRAAVAFQILVLPKSIVTGPATARTFTFASIPPGNPLPSFPAGVGFVSALIAVGDTSAGGEGESVRSGDSNPFFARGRIPVPPGSPVVQ